MRLLVDTHVLFWSLVDDPKLPIQFKQLMRDPSNSSFVSVVSGWEIATKVRIGKWPEAALLLPGLTQKVKAAGLGIEPLSLDQAEQAGSLLLDHQDPFDRLLAAQAMDRAMVMLSVDPVFAAFGCNVI